MPRKFKTLFDPETDANEQNEWNLVVSKSEQKRINRILNVASDALKINVWNENSKKTPKNSETCN